MFYIRVEMFQFMVIFPFKRMIEATILSKKTYMDNLNK